MARITSIAIAVLLSLSFHILPAEAQLARTFVSSLGNDANDCNRLTPCRTFQRAHNQTLSLGEITVLDPGGYGAVTITKGISIINDGVGEAGVLVSGGLNGITIDAPATEAVSLRGLTVKGIGFGGGNGIVFNTGKSLTIENCAVRNLTGVGAIGFGIKFFPNSTSSLNVSNTLVADNELAGFWIRPVGFGTVRVLFNRVELYNNGSLGIYVDGGAAAAGSTLNATVGDSVAAVNGIGVQANTVVGHATTSLMVVRSVFANNGKGIVATSTFLRVAQSTVTGNNVSWEADQLALFQSFGDNNVIGNGDGDPVMPTIAKK
jgi:hypothetical protein